MLVAKLRASRDRMRQQTGHCEGRVGYKTEEGKKLIRYINSLLRKPKYGRRRTLQQVADILNAEGKVTHTGHVWTLYR